MAPKKKKQQTGDQAAGAARAQWDMLFAAEEALIDRAKVLLGSPEAGIVKHNKAPARIGIAWTDPTQPIIYAWTRRNSVRDVSAAPRRMSIETSNRCSAA
jgi:hypothetical protein